MFRERERESQPAAHIMEKLLGSAKELSIKVENNEVAAGELLKQCEELQEQLKSMKQVRLLEVWYWYSTDMPFFSTRTACRR